jgi:hypothetical protein
MGLSIHYSGTIKTYDLVPQLVEEIGDVCAAMQWKTTTIGNEQLNGIAFSSYKCEPLFLTINKKGKLVSPILLEYKIEPATTISVKTQFARIDVHIAVIKFLRYLAEKYFSKFDLEDERGYWETNNEQFLAKRFKDYEAVFDFVIGALKNIPARKNETADSLASRITAYLEQKMSNDGLSSNRHSS